MPRIVDHDLYRISLLDRCGQLFVEHGYAALSMRQIAEHLKVSTGTLYHYFESKEDLFRKLVHHVGNVDLSRWHELLGNVTDPAERLDIFLHQVEADEAYWLSQYLVICDYARAVGHANFAADPTLAEATRRYHDLLSELLGVPPHLFVFIDNFIGGLLMNRFLVGGGVSFNEQARLLRAMLALYQAEHSASAPTPDGIQLPSTEGESNE